VRRSFLGAVPLTVKAGYDLRQAVFDIRGATETFNYVGPDAAGARLQSATTIPLPFLDSVYSQRILPYGFPALQTVSNRKVWEHYVAHPEYWTVNEAATYNAFVANSKFSDELISALYVRGDTALFDGRLKLVGGLRAEQTTINAAGPLVDNTRNVQRDASGRPVLAGGKPVPITTDPLAAAKLTNLDRGAPGRKGVPAPLSESECELHAQRKPRGAGVLLLVGWPAGFQPVLGRHYLRRTLMPHPAPPTGSCSTTRPSRPGRREPAACARNIILAGSGGFPSVHSAGKSKGCSARRSSPRRRSLLALYNLPATLFGNYDVATPVQLDTQFAPRAWTSATSRR
jgi:hypothetical protein